MTAWVVAGMMLGLVVWSLFMLLVVFCIIAKEMVTSD